MKQINAAIQVLPRSKTIHTYDLVDSAIEIIKKSGLKYRVCPFETVVEGSYEDVMNLVKEVQDACYDNGAEEMLVYLKIQSTKNSDVTIGDKMDKYDK
ncbi:MAG: thiamine-binding protein [Bacteroidota bacterium]|nr:thiamine-binding protein [Bacteroidota bacterium]